MRAVALERGRVGLEIHATDGTEITMALSPENAEDLILQMACAMGDGVEALSDGLIRVFLLGASVYSQLGIQLGKSQGGELEAVSHWCQEGTRQEPEELRKVLDIGYRAREAIAEAQELERAGFSCKRERN